MIEEKLQQLQIIIPEAPKPLAAYVPAVIDGNLVFTAGQLPIISGELKYKGKVGSEVSENDGQKAAEICVINCLSAVKSATGDLNRVERIIKVTVFVNSASGFNAQPKIANGASELLVKIFGEAGKHARSAVGVCELPLNAAVEVELIAKLK